jgi:hypothetical protein
MNEREREAYVRAALVAQGYAFDPAGDAERIAEIVRQFARIEGIAAAMLDAQLPPELEPAAVFRP